MSFKAARTAIRMKDVAERANVSRMAASAVLMGTGNGRIRVSEATAKAIQEAAEELGYRPNQAARQLAGKSSGVIALVVRDVRNFLTQKVLAELHHQAQRQQLRLLTIGSYPELEGLAQVVRDTEAGWLDGVIYLAHENQSQWNDLEACLPEDLPVVCLLGEVPAGHLASAASDVRPGAVASIEHLVETGRRRILLLTEQTESIDIRQRIAAYTASLQAAGIPFGPDQVVVATRGWFLSDPATHPRFDKLTRRLVERKGADAVLCDSDFTAAGLSRSARRLGIACPDQLAIVGWGDLQFAGLFDPPLTSVADDLPRLIESALRMIQAESFASNNTVCIPTQLMIRDTA